MKKLILIAFILLYSSTAYSEHKSITFTPYDNNALNESVDEYGAHVFEGDIRVTGILYIAISKENKNENATVITSYFAPDDASLKRLPNVVGEPIKFIGLETTNDMLAFPFIKDKNFEKYKRGEMLKVSVTIDIKKLLTDIECDARSYWTTSFSIISVGNDIIHNSVVLPNGC